MPNYKFSNAHRWSVCTGSLTMEDQSPRQEQSTWAKDGEDWAREAEIVLKTGAPDYSSDIAPYVEFVRSLPGDMLIETKVTAPVIHPQCVGIPDAVVDDGHTLSVGDLKMGYRPVSAYRNKQLICGAAAHLQGSHKKFRLFISQPTLTDEIDVWEPTREELEWEINSLNMAANSPDPRLVSGTHCLYCRALLSCDAARDASLTAAEIAGAKLHPPENIGREIRILRGAQNTIKTRLAALEAQGIEMAKRGELLEGLDIKPTVGRRAWDIPEIEIIRMGDLMGIDVAPRKLLSPAQAETAGLNKEYVKSVASSKVTGHTLVNTKNAEEIFKP